MKEVLKFFENDCSAPWLVWIATNDANNRPHLAPVCFVKVIDRKIIIANNFIAKTVKNIKENPVVAVAISKRLETGFDGYLVKGRAEVHHQGKYYDTIKKFVEEKSGGRRRPKSAVVITPEEVYSLKPGEGRKKVL
jgi:hypothetical protein